MDSLTKLLANVGSIILKPKWTSSLQLADPDSNAKAGIVLILGVKVFEEIIGRGLRKDRPRLV